ncbi:MAG: thioredoxin domain-containing protein [Phycisphaerae bacterium]|nr:thioredoxin domain-containing protein [Phycisphaerae bacterium]
MTQDPITTNRLAACTSPYLLQHAANPVDWWPWCDEALALARRLDRPLFVSIGYSTCYWCHVMERESFEDPAIGQALREGFVAIKVDREEHPSVDEWLMTACQVMTELTDGKASGGWPLNGFIDPHSMRAFHVGTYYPPRLAHGRPSFRSVIDAMRTAWTTRRTDVNDQANRIGAIVEDVLTRTAPSCGIPASLPAQVAQALLRFEDTAHGGFGGAPKFPQPCYLRLMREAAHALPTLQPTVGRALNGMVCGGLFDQVGGGFHRYCVDASWTVPHFEKMLYDNGQLLELLAAEHTRDPDDRWAESLRRTVIWIDREMSTEDGSCIAALDAEVDGREGLNYLWTPLEAADALSSLDEDMRHDAILALGLDRPNFIDPHHADAPPSVVPTRRPWRTSAGIERACQALLAVRQTRRAPRRDTKIILEWNGLLVEGLATAAMALRDDRLVLRAAQLAEALWQGHQRSGSWHRTRCGSVMGPPATLADVACLGLGLETLWRATGDELWLTRAQTIERAARAAWSSDGRWWADSGSGGLPVRVRSHHDGTVPSGLSSILDLQVRVALATRDRAEGRDALDALARTVHAESGTIMTNPVSLSWAVAALARAMRKGLLEGTNDNGLRIRTTDRAMRRIVCTETACTVEWA